MNLDLLVQKFQNKEISAFEQLYEMYSENIYGVINTIIQNPETSQEICQDVFLRVWEKADTYNPSKGRFFTWVLNIARNAAIDQVRSKSYKQQKKNLSTDYFVDILESSEDLEGKMDTIGLKKLLVNLKEKCLQIIKLLYFQGFTQKEAAEELNIPVGTVKTRNRSCIAKIRENIKI